MSDKENIFKGENPVLKGVYEGALASHCQLEKEQEKKWLYEFAGRAMQGMFSSGHVNFREFETNSELAVKQAKDLLERLKKKDMAEEKNPLTNLEKWEAVDKVYWDNPQIEHHPFKWLDSKGVSADEAYRILIEEGK